MDRGAWWAAVHGVTRVRYDFATKPPPSTHRDAQSYACQYLMSAFYESEIFLYIVLLDLHNMLKTQYY